MNKYLILFLSMILISFPISVNALSLEPVIKDNIKLTLLDNTDFCDTECYSVYEVCYNDVNLKIDFDVKFINNETNFLPRSKYLDVSVIDTKYNIVGCEKITVHGIKGKFESIDNIPIIKGVEFSEFAMWSSSYPFRIEINFTTEIPLGFEFMVNDTHGISNNFIWTNKVDESMFIYCDDENCTGLIAIGNDTDELNWEDEETLTGNNPTDVWSNGLIGVWHFGEGVGSDTDDSHANENDGTFINTPTWNDTAIYVESLFFQPDTDYIDLNDDASLNIDNSNFSIMTWVIFSDHATDGGYLFSKGEASTNHALQFGIKSDGAFGMAFYGDDLWSSWIPDLNTWYLLVGTYDAGTNERIIYYNGNYLDSDTATNDLTGSDGFHANIGRGIATANTIHHGNLDEVRLYNRVLTPLEINYTYYNGIDNLTFTGNKSEFVEPPEPEVVINESRNYCLDNDTLIQYRFIINNEVINETSEHIYCLHGCVDDIYYGGSVCNNPEWITYGIVILILLGIVILIIKKG